MTKDGPKPKDMKKWKRSELRRFMELSEYFEKNNEGSVQTKYGLVPHHKYMEKDFGTTEDYIPDEGAVNELGADDYALASSQFIKDIPLLTITLTDEMIEKLLADSAPIRLGKATGGLVNRMIKRKRK